MLHTEISEHKLIDKDVIRLVKSLEKRKSLGFLRRIEFQNFAYIRRDYNQDLYIYIYIYIYINVGVESTLA